MAPDDDNPGRRNDGGSFRGNIGTAFEDIEFPDAMPASPTQAEDGYYDYDDMSVHYDLSFETYNYGATVPDDDPIKGMAGREI